MTRISLPIHLLLATLAPLMWLLAACADDSGETAAGGRLTLVLNISDLPAMSRSDAPGGDNGIESLRVIVARPGGDVEANRLIIPDTGGLQPDDVIFEIVPDPWKHVFLVANEASTGLDLGGVARIDPDALGNPGAHPGDIVSLLVGDVPVDAQIPMSAVYRLATSQQYARPDGNGRLVVAYDVHLMRTMAKFTFNIINRRQTPVSISNLGISGIGAPHHWLFPHVTTTSLTGSVHYLDAAGTSLAESGTGLPPGGTAAAPGTDYFRDRYLASATGHGSRVFVEGEVVLPVQDTPLTLDFHHPECAVDPDADPGAPFTLFIEFDGNRYTCPLDNLPSLPRNTHVVVNLTFSNNDKILEVEVMPYHGVDLYPGFGH